MSQPQVPIERAFAEFLHLEQQARAARNTETLAYSMVNESLGLFGFRHAALLINGRVRAVTGVSAPDPHAPFVAFIERAARQLVSAQHADQLSTVDASWLDEPSRQEWQALSAPEVLWLPLKDRQQQLIGGLWLARDTLWQAAEKQLLAQLGEAWSHAWLALEPRRVWRAGSPRIKVLAVVVALMALLLVPVRQSVLAPAEVVPLNGRIITAPLDGVIADILVRPNERVKAGEVLVRFDSTTLKAQADVAERALGVAEAELRSGTQRAFQDAESKARLDLLSAQVAQKRTELMYASELLSRTEIKADRDGIAVYADDDRLRGKPMKTGEKLMALADPRQAELKIQLDVGDAIRFPSKARVALFPDSDPTTRHDAWLERVAYEAATGDRGALTYRLDARFTEAAPRIGLRGTAKIYGSYVPMAVYLFRRPVAALRKTVGF